MTSIALAVFCIFIIYVIIWCIRNDGARSIREQTGLIKMRPPAQAADAAGDSPPSHRNLRETQNPKTESKSVGQDASDARRRP